MKNLEHALRSVPEHYLQESSSQKSLRKGVYYRGYCPKEEWSIEFYDQDALLRGKIAKGKPIINCGKPSDMHVVQDIFPELINKDTDVFHTYCGVKIKHLGSLGKVRESYPLADEQHQDLESVIEISDEDILDSTEIDKVIDLAEWKGCYQKTRIEPEIYQQIFAQHKELGLSIDYFVRKDHAGREKDDFRYRMKKKAGVAGGWVSREYAAAAVNALADYQELLREDSLESLAKAECLAENYFTLEAVLEAKSKIGQRREEKLKMVDSAATSLDPGYLISSYDHLIKSGEWEDLKKAEQLAGRYLRKEAQQEICLKLRQKARELGQGINEGKLLPPNTAKQVFSYLVRDDDSHHLSLAENIARMYLPSHIAARVKEKRQELGANPDLLVGRNNDILITKRIKFNLAPIQEAV